MDDSVFGKYIFNYKEKSSKAWILFLVGCIAIVFSLLLGFVNAFAASQDLDNTEKLNYDVVQSENNVEINDFYNDGNAIVTTHIDGYINPKTGKVDFNGKISFQNNSEKEILSINSTKLDTTNKFTIREFGIGNLTSNGNTIFNGGIKETYETSVLIDPKQTIQIDVSTSLDGLLAGKYANKTPVRFIYSYDMLSLKTYANLNGSNLTFYHDLYSSRKTGEVYYINKNGDMSGEGASDYTKNVYFDDSFKNFEPHTCVGGFSGFGYIENVYKLTNVNTTYVEEFNNFFCGCTSLKYIEGVEDFMSSYGKKNFTSFFKFCEGLKNLNLEKGNVKVSDCHMMFCCCKNLESLNVDNFDVSPCGNFCQAFHNMLKIKKIDLKNGDLSNAYVPSGGDYYNGLGQMFYAGDDAYSIIEEIDISHKNNISLPRVGTYSLAGNFVFANNPKLRKIGVPNGCDWSTTIPDNDCTFSGCSNLLTGGTGKVWSSNDSGAHNCSGKGYFTPKIENQIDW